jgi:hypothetical protein
VAYGVVVAGTADRLVWAAIAELVGERFVTVGDGRLVVRLPDQSAMVALLCRLNDIGVKVDQVQRFEGEGAITAGEPSRLDEP